MILAVIISSLRTALNFIFIFKCFEYQTIRSYSNERTRICQAVFGDKKAV